MLEHYIGHGEMDTDGNSSFMWPNQTITSEDAHWAACMMINVTFMYFGTTIAGMEKWITLGH